MSWTNGLAYCEREEEKKVVLPRHLAVDYIQWL